MLIFNLVIGPVTVVQPLMVYIRLFPGCPTLDATFWPCPPEGEASAFVFGSVCYKIRYTCAQGEMCGQKSALQCHTENGTNKKTCQCRHITVNKSPTAQLLLYHHYYYCFFFYHFSHFKKLYIFISLFFSCIDAYCLVLLHTLEFNKGYLILEECRHRTAVNNTNRTMTWHTEAWDSIQHQQVNK